MARKKLPWKNNRRVNGDKAAKDLENKVKALTLAGVKNNEIAKQIERSPQHVWNIQNKLVQDGELKRNASTGRLEKPQNAVSKQNWEALKNEEFMQIDCIAKWVKYLESKNKGKGLASGGNNINAVFVVCSTLKISPCSVLDHRDPNTGEPAHLDKLTEILTEFKQRLDAGTVNYVNSKVAAQQKKQTGTQDIQMTRYAKGWASFFDAHGKSIPRNYGGKGHVVSRAKTSYAQYADVQLSDKQIFDLLDYLAAINIGYAQIAGLMIEGITRTKPIFNWYSNLAIKEIELEDNRTYKYGEFKIFETKTETTWTKIVIDPKVLQLCENLQLGKTIFPDMSKEKITTFQDLLRKYYVKIGLLDERVLLPLDNPNHLVYPLGTNQSYLDSHPAYTLRHSGAHRGMRRTGYNATIIASFGHEDIKTLTDSYAKMPSEMLFKQKTCYYCNPPANRNTDNLYFDSIAHALIYLNNGHKSKSEDGQQ